MVVLVITACGRGEAISATDQTTPAQTTIATVIPTASATSDRAVAEPRELGVAGLIQLGYSVYAANCAPCHQPNGEGKLNRFPALNGNAFVQAQQLQPLLQTVLHGRGGVMPGFASTLSDQEIAAVLSYVRNAWSNSAPLIEANQVSQVKAVTTPTPAVIGEETGQPSP